MTPAGTGCHGNPPRLRKAGVVREGLLGKVRSQHRPEACRGPGWGKSKVEACPKPGDPEGVHLRSGWATAGDTGPGGKPGDADWRGWQGQAMQGPGGHTKNAGLHPKGKGYEQGRDITRLVFQKDYSGCCVLNTLQEHGSRRQRLLLAAKAECWGARHSECQNDRGPGLWLLIPGPTTETWGWESSHLSSPTQPPA